MLPLSVVPLEDQPYDFGSKIEIFHLSYKQEVTFLFLLFKYESGDADVLPSSPMLISASTLAANIVP